MSLRRHVIIFEPYFPTGSEVIKVNVTFDFSSYESANLIVKQMFFFFILLKTNKNYKLYLTVKILPLFFILGQHNNSISPHKVKEMVDIRNTIKRMTSYWVQLFTTH